jgi:serine/threonine-protein kinase
VDDASGSDRLIAHRYRLEGRLNEDEAALERDANPVSGWTSNRDSAGSVWRARDVRLGVPVAIKFLDPAIADDPTSLEGFFWEVRAAAALSNPHATKIHDHGVESGAPYFVMELLEGETLEARLVRGRLRAPDLDRIFRQGCQALDEAHELGLVHRDLKPANVFLARAGGRETTKLLFGIAKIMNDTLELVRKMASQRVASPDTVAYMSPEQVLGKSTLDHRSDLWSLAVMAFECMTGRLPFPGDTLGDRLIHICTAAPLLPSKVCHVPAGFDAWFMRGVSKAPAARFASALEMSEALTQILTRQETNAAG